MENVFRRSYEPPPGIIVSLAMLLLLSDASLAYITAPMAKVCTRDEDLSSEWDLEPDSNTFRQMSMLLDGSGHRSAARLSAKMSDPPCSLTIEVPKDTHAIAVSLKNFPEGIDCPLSLWFHEGTNKDEAWSLDLCDGGKKRFLALYPQIYPYRVTLRWNPVFPAKAFLSNDTRLNRVLTSEEQLEIVATAVGRGAVCEEENRVLCWKIMKESLCVSEELACDGYHNCPRPGNDESESMCPQTRNGGADVLKEGPAKAFNILADHFRRMMAVRAGDPKVTSPSVNSSFRINNGGLNSGRKEVVGGSREASKEAEGGEGSKEGIEFAVFAKLGPWTFVLLCMLACGSLLLLCGLWECCCRSRGPTPALALSPRGSMVAAGGGGQQTTTVVIISSSTPPPPEYEELEQPPDYMELFPGRSKSTVL